MSNRVRLMSLLFLFAFILASGGGAASADEPAKGVPAKSAPRWEYKSVQMSLGATTADMDKAFNPLGEQGWELATSNSVVYPGGTGGITNYVFKRPKR
jgi:hypothetical protein